MLDGKEYKEYFDQDYFETMGYKSNYDKSNMTRDSYLHKAIACWITQTLHLGGSESVLEIGCAFGWVVEQMIKTYSLDCYGQDISQYSINNAPSIIQDRVKECEDFEIIFDTQFDLIYSLETFEHVPEDKISTYFENMYNALNADGLVFCTICLGHNNDRGADIDRSHQTLQPRSWWNKKFNKAGFTIRKDLEANAYELGLQTAEMDSGKWLPREFNWHVFVAQKRQQVTAKFSIVNSSKQNMLIVGDRAGEFSYPIHDFFQIDNWGNYLSGAFNCDYKDAGCALEHNLLRYDIIMGSLSELVIDFFVKTDYVGKKIGIIEGTPYFPEDPHLRPDMIKCLNDLSLIYSTIPKGQFLYGIYCDKNKIVNCGHVFPINKFDKLYDKQDHPGFTILTGGYFNSRHGLSSTSVYLASQFADEVITITNEYYLKEFQEAHEVLPDNVNLLMVKEQDKFWSEVLPQIDLLLHLNEHPAQGRLVADCAAAKIPAIGVENLFQVRCYPELLIDHLYDIGQVKSLLIRLKTDSDYYDYLISKSRDRLRTSNLLELTAMVKGLNMIGFKGVGLRE